MHKPVVLITGASSGIGYELAKLFAADKYSLILVSRDPDNLQRAQEELKKKYQAETQIIATDLSSLEAPTKIFDFIRQKNIKIDVLINDAGFGLVGLFNDLDEQKQLEMIDLNIRALTQLTKLFLNQAALGAKILNVASLAAFQPGPLMTVYYATKAYVLSFSEALAEELMERKITVTALCPGPVATNFWQTARPANKKILKSRLMDQLTADQVARAGYEGLKKGQRIVIPGVLNKSLAFLIRFLPRRSVTKIVKKINT